MVVVVVTNVLRPGLHDQGPHPSPDAGAVRPVERGGRGRGARERCRPEPLHNVKSRMGHRRGSAEGQEQTPDMEDTRTEAGAESTDGNSHHPSGGSKLQDAGWLLVIVVAVVGEGGRGRLYVSGRPGGAFAAKS
jgi:hypothetical protein